MAKTVSDLQVGIRHHARDDLLVLTDTGTLAHLNRIYRSLASLLPWSEFRRTDTTLTTTAGTGTYDWPTTDIFLDVRAVEIQDADNLNFYRLIYPPVDETVWNEASRKPTQSIPDHYVRFSSNIKAQIEFRPAPKYDSKTIRITGTIEPKKLVSANDKTLFYSSLADDVLEMLVSVDYVDQAGGQEGHFWADKLMQKAGTLLKQIFGKDVVPEELLRQVIQG